MTAEEQQSRAVLKTLTGRPWTRLGTVALAAHVFYELAAGVGMPFASRLGAGPAAAVWGSGSVLVFRHAGRQDRSDDKAFAVLNGMFLTAVLAHFTGWPRRRARCRCSWSARGWTET